MTYRIRLVLPSAVGTYTRVRYVTDDRRSWDAGWLTEFAREAKTWKTRAGAERWLAERPGVRGYNVAVEEIP
ncbi:MAG: hypothetical protein ACRDV9_13430 [Acidimicrobiia bacterium]